MYYLLLHEKTVAKLHAIPSYKSCMFLVYYDLQDLSTALMYATDTIIAPYYHVDWGARNFYFENLVVLASLYLFNEDHADVTVPLQDSCLMPSSDIVSEAKSPFVLVEVEPDSCQLLLGFLASVPLTNCLYSVDEVDPTQADYSEIFQLAQLSSKLTSPPLLHGLDMDQGCEANLSTIGNQDHVDVTLLASLRYRGH